MIEFFPFLYKLDLRVFFCASFIVPLVASFSLKEKEKMKLYFFFYYRCSESHSVLS